MSDVYFVHAMDPKTMCCVVCGRALPEPTGQGFFPPSEGYLLVGSDDEHIARIRANPGDPAPDTKFGSMFPCDSPSRAVHDVMES